MTYLIAEIGSTHDGSLGNAIRAIDVFAELGASAIKFQDHRGQNVDTKAKHPAWFQGEDIESRSGYLVRTQFKDEQWDAIASTCKKRRADFVVSPFSKWAAYEQAPRVDAFKVASGQVTNLPLLQTLVELGKPVHLSSGMSTDGELSTAARILAPVLRSVMVCVSEYPSRPEMWALDEMGDWGDWGGGACGYSDHSGGIVAPILAAWEGARVIEVHVTLSRRLYGSDAAHSLEPEEFARLVGALKQVERAKKGLTRAQRVAMLGEVRKEFMA